LDERGTALVSAKFDGSKTIRSIGVLKDTSAPGVLSPHSKETAADRSHLILRRACK
jgi:hypothetical protein